MAIDSDPCTPSPFWRCVPRKGTSPHLRRLGLGTDCRLYEPCLTRRRSPSLVSRGGVGQLPSQGRGLLVLAGQVCDEPPKLIGVAAVAETTLMHIEKTTTGEGHDLAYQAVSGS